MATTSATRHTTSKVASSSGSDDGVLGANAADAVPAPEEEDVMLLQVLRVTALVSALGLTAALAVNDRDRPELTDAERAERAAEMFPAWSCPRPDAQ